MYLMIEMDKQDYIYNIESLYEDNDVVKVLSGYLYVRFTT
jgi:hypothetical protein